MARPDVPGEALGPVSEWLCPEGELAVFKKIFLLLLVFCFFFLVARNYELIHNRTSAQHINTTATMLHFCNMTSLEFLSIVESSNSIIAVIMVSCQ